MARLKTALLVVLFFVGAFYLVGELIYAATRDRASFSALESGVRLAHIVSAFPLLLLPIIQFSRELRAKKPSLHRQIGRLYLASAIVASLGAIYLGMTFEEAGRRPPLVIFAALWLVFSVAAWVCARRGDYATHAKFVVRSYGVALAFVFVRVLGGFEAELFGFIASDEVRNATREWLAFVLPLLAIEITLSWAPAFRQSARRQRSARSKAKPSAATGLS